MRIFLLYGLFIGATCSGSFVKETLIQEENASGRNISVVQFKHNDKYVATVSEVWSKDGRLLFRSEFYGCESSRCPFSIGIHEDGKISFSFESEESLSIRYEDTDRDGLPNFIWIKKEEDLTRLERSPTGELRIWSDDEEEYIEPNDADNPVKSPENPNNQADD